MAMTEEAKEARNRYMRENYSKPENKEKRKQYYRQYCEKNKERIRGYQENYWLRKAEKEKGGIK